MNDITTIAGGGFSNGTVDLVGGTDIDFAGGARTGGGTTAIVDTTGRWECDDLEFTNIANPGEIGNIDVSGNYQNPALDPD